MTANGETGRRLHVFVSGRVQGVGFRYFVQRAAAETGLTGWVRNLRDGRVELVAEGPDPALAQFTATLRRGPPSSFVSDVETSWSTPTGEFRDFAIWPSS